MRHLALLADAYWYWQDHHAAVIDHQLPAGTPRGDYMFQSTLQSTPAVLLTRQRGNVKVMHAMF